MPSFERSGETIERLEDYLQVLEPVSWNWARISKVTALSVGGTAVLVPLALVAAPAIGGALGATILTSAAGAPLSGAAASSAGLAWLGGGAVAAGGLGVAGGTLVVGAAGGGLGAASGAVVGAAYLGDVDGFELVPLKAGSGPTVIVSNGFLSQDEDQQGIWTEQLARIYPSNPWYIVRWESKRLRNLGGALAGAVGRGTLKKIAAKAARRATRTGAKGLSQIFILLDAVGVAKNDWHVALVKAQQTGAMLADALARVRGGRFILIGHSLGARVMHEALVRLGTRNQPCVDRAHLMGAAVGGGRTVWEDAARATRFGIENYFSKNDRVLSVLYRVAQLGLSRPVGYHGVELRIPGVYDHDVSQFVDGHMAFKPNMHRFIGVDS